MAQSQLEKEGIEYRKNNVDAGSNKYRNQNGQIYEEGSEYTLTHNDEEHPLGKGTGKSMGYSRINHDANKNQINYSNIDTTQGGGSYDIYGRNGVGGRERSIKMNLYSKDNPYDPNSISIDETIKGQFYIKK